VFALVLISTLQSMTTGAFVAACVESHTLATDWPLAVLLVAANLGFVLYLAFEEGGKCRAPFQETGGDVAANRVGTAVASGWAEGDLFGGQRGSRHRHALALDRCRNLSKVWNMERGIDL
jgi:hypothetical protein